MLSPIGVPAALFRLYNVIYNFMIYSMFHRIPLSLRTRGEIDLEEAKRQHETYVR